MDTQKLLEQDKKNYEAYIKAGEIFEDRQNAYERMTKAVEKLQAGVQRSVICLGMVVWKRADVEMPYSLADLLNLTPPKLPTAASLAKSGLQIVNTGSAFDKDGEETVGTGIWDDEEERKFYEDILDLADDVPPTFLGLKTNGEPEQPSADDAAVLSPETKPGSAYSDAEDVHQSDSGKTGTNGEVVEGLGLEGLKKLTADEGDPLQSGPAARLTAVFAALPEANNRTVIDKLAVDFAYLNSKAARKRCIKVCAFWPELTQPTLVAEIGLS